MKWSLVTFDGASEQPGLLEQVELVFARGVGMRPSTDTSLLAISAAWRICLAGFIQGHPSFIKGTKLSIQLGPL
jgi:hypothetical protein